MSEFKKGDIIKMAVASRSHVIAPYYVLILEYNANAKDGEIKMITEIPGKHSLQMVVGSNWEYHYPRMTKVGTLQTHAHLLLNQDLTHKKYGNT